MRIDGRLLNLLLGGAAASPAAEVCGLIFGTSDKIMQAVLTRNVAIDPATAFEVDPAVLIAALRAEREGGASLIGHYHSHPNGSAEPSARDLVAAEPGKLWLILASDRARLWRAEMGSFRELQLIVN